MFINIQVMNSKIVMQNLKQIYKHPSAFKRKNEIKNDGRFSHNIFKADKLKKSINSPKSQWFVKFLGEKRIETLAEVLTQEMMRLILPYQPKTRRLINITQEKRIHYYVLSKEIPQFDDKFFLHPENTEQIHHNKITGLAATQILALWLNEVDFKAGNVGVDHNGRVIKIDGGLSFIILNPGFDYLHNNDYRITPDDLEALPNLVNYAACNWLHHIQWTKEGYAKKKEPTEFDKIVNQSVYFKSELYRTILHIISLPNEFITFFTKNYIANSTDVAKFSNFMIERKQQLEDAANTIPAFNTYRLSNQGQGDLFNFLTNLKNFKTMEKLYLVDAFHDRYGINAESLIIEKEINFMLNTLATDLDNYLAYLNLNLDVNNPIDIDMSSFNLKELSFYIRYLKNSITNYLTSSNNAEEDNFYDDLAIVLKTLEPLKDDFLIKDSSVLYLIESIKKIMLYKDHLPLKVKKPIPSPRKNKPLPSLIPITFFNQIQPNASEINQPLQSMLSY